ncbi:hypothetical protein SAMN04487957_10548 [Halomonas shengliensis]|uniref:Uncharacterized protein n=1 Tax=Halomonas shengliensis TaxID=419597 RepID=A0A1H0IAQ5_9GAMM|nr:hypothetical protein [Halomonas shengliensis]SDO28446.1 hypothetical protein SAMN04487957_10548 [Halomonas shengliensis]
MKVSMNGLRRNLNGDVETLRRLVEAVLEGEWYDKEDLRDAMNDVIRDSNVLNCVYHKDDPDFSDMGQIEVELLEEEPAE